MSYRSFAALVVLCAALGACSTTQESTEQNDPFEPLNRQIFGFNQKLDNRVALPVATFYRSAAPEVLRVHLHNFLTNLRLPVTVANDVLQGNIGRGGEAVERFAVNSTLGVAGVFDVATGWDLPYHQEDFGQTMGWYGIPEGPYMVLPLAGPTDPRDLGGGVVDGYINPLGYIQWRHKNYYWSWPIRVLSLMDQRSLSVDDLREIQRQSIDLYATMRTVYRQTRNAEIHNGEPTVEGLPDF